MKLIFSSLQASDLVNTGSRWDAQDPALRITIGKEKKETARMKDVGTEASFPETLEFELPDGTTNQEVCLLLLVLSLTLLYLHYYYFMTYIYYYAL